MSRDIKKYEESYLNNNDFEKYQINYRRKKILEILKKYNPRKVLEIGCGMEPLFINDGGREYVIVEPAKQFYDNAVKKSAFIRDGSITVYNAFFLGGGIYHC